MAVIVNTGSTLTITQANGLTLTADSTIEAGGVLDGAGTIAGPFALINDGFIESTVSKGTVEIDSAAFTNNGLVMTTAADTTMVIGSSVAVSNFSNGTLTGGTWNVEDRSTLLFEPGVITTDNATIAVSGSGSFEDFNSLTGSIQPILNSLSVVGTSGILDLRNQNWAASGPIVDNGEVVAIITTISAVGGITIAANASLIDTDSPFLSPLTVNGTLDVNGSLFLPSTVAGSGPIVVDSSGELRLQPGAYTPAIINNGPIVNDPGGIVTFAGGISGSGGFVINGGSDAASTSGFELPASLTNNTVVFPSDYGEVILDSASTFTGRLADFDNNDTIVLRNLIANSASLGTIFTANGYILTVSNNGIPVAALSLDPKVSLQGPNQYYGNATFTATPDLLKNLTTITASGIIYVICFRAGTRIATPNGDVPVEQLAARDRVQTHFAGERRVVWIGQRTIDCRRHPDPSTILPVRVTADAFGPGRPRRDLFLSPGHALFVDGVLIPVKCLIDGETIRQVDTDTVTYFHVELDEHDVLFAEGLGAESYLDTGNRPQFANGGPSVALFPDFRDLTWEALGCAPLVMTGAPVANLRAMLARRTASATNPPKLALTPAA